MIDKKIEWDNWEAILTGDNNIELRNILEDKRTPQNINERIINVSFQSNYLIVTTLTKCRIYNIEKPTTFNSVDLKGNVLMLLQNPKCFCLVDSETGLNIYSYEGKSISKPSIPGLKRTISLISSGSIELEEDSNQSRRDSSDRYHEHESTQAVRCAKWKAIERSNRTQQRHQRVRSEQRGSWRQQRQKNRLLGFEQRPLHLTDPQERSCTLHV